MPEAWAEELERDWSGQFFRQVYSQVNEDRFARLLSDKASRPNKPVRLMVSLLAWKSLFNMSDAEVIGALKYDQRLIPGPGAHLDVPNPP